MHMCKPTHKQNIERRILFLWCDEMRLKDGEMERKDNRQMEMEQEQKGNKNLNTTVSSAEVESNGTEEKAWT